MKIAILTLGTRGDVQPYAVLGQALKKRGHEVTLSTAANFKDLVSSCDIDFLPVEADYQALLNSAEGRKMMKANPFAVRRNLNKWVYPLVQQSLHSFYNLVLASDKVIYHVKTMADCFADQFPQKMIRAMVVPAVQATKEFPNPALSGLPIPSFMNYSSYMLMRLGTGMLNKPISRFRESAGLSSRYKIADTPFIYGISPLFLKQPDDYPPNCIFTGFWFGNTAADLSQDIQSFAVKDTPPLLLTFGSMPFQCSFDLQEAILKLTAKLQARMIIVKGWGLHRTDKLENNPSIKVIDAAPYEKLFPLVRAVIHHGGAGTTAACLQAGKPFFVCPILYPIGDQQFWGQVAFEKGLAVKPIALKKLTEDLFLTRCAELLNNKQLYVRAELFAAKLKAEDGLGNAIAEIEKIKR